MAQTAGKPTVASILSLIGGIIIIIFGAFFAIVGAGLTSQIGGVGGLFGLFGMVTGVLVIIGAVKMRSRPEQHIIWGVVVIAFSILSWIGSLGGFGIGFIIGLIGGILGILWKPSVVQPAPEEFSTQS